MTRTRQLVVVALAVAGAGCGSRTGLDDRPVDRPTVPRGPEVCDGVDNDLDATVDEPFRDELGRYVHDDHCGACDRPCRPDGGHVVSTACTLVEGTPLCVATECDEGYAPAPTGGCVPIAGMLCLPCYDDGDCGFVSGARCAFIGEELRCTLSCEERACPDGYVCEDGLCMPPGRSCWCDPGESFVVACTIFGEPEEGEEAPECIGSGRCEDGALTECSAYGEVCDGLDNDCNGEVDDPFRDDYGAYVDIHNCGACGVDCTRSPLPEGDLTCGGDPFLPMCVLLCEDTLDGIDPGDRVDADLLFSNGCECTVRSVTDEPGPIGAVGEDLDVNCDGADGETRRSVYVAPDGDDEQPGSPLFPVRTIASALEIAEASLETDHPRPHVFVAAGTYGEVLRVPEGVQVHGGYRSDFLALDPETYESVVYAASDAETPGGAVLLIEDATFEPTLVEGMRLHGASAPDESGAAFGVLVLGSSDAVTLRNLTVYAGHGAAGRHGEDGAAGTVAGATGALGTMPRGAIEDTRHVCLPSDSGNTVRGGAGGVSRCAGVDVSGGAGGDATCPTFAEEQGDGRPGLGTGAGRGGGGGTDSQGPILEGWGCHEPVCCGLADYTVPLDMAYAGDGENGDAGDPGTAGDGCSDPIGRLELSLWTPGAASTGGVGRPGSGGGGGGAGGGAEMTWESWYPDHCDWPDGLGGGGGGGGGGGCGGAGGTPGTSGGPSIGVLVAWGAAGGRVTPPTLDSLTIVAGDGGAGGRGGAGGDGSPGGAGGVGGEIPREDMTTPTLAGPTPGGHGGAGGEGGPGGGGGGGCGGSSVGVLVWLAGSTTSVPVETSYRSATTVTLGRPGPGGTGGGGARAGEDGLDGMVQDVLVR